MEQIKQKLVYILHGLGPGGVETALLSAIPRLMEEFDLHIVCIGKIKKSFLNDLSDDTLLRIRAFDYPLLFLPISIFRAFLFILKINPNIIIASLWKASLTTVLVRKFRKEVLFISFIHSSTFFNKPDQVFTKMAIKNCDVIFCDSQASSKFIKQYANKKPISIISFLRFGTPEECIVKKDLKKNAVFLGRLSGYKRIDTLLQIIFHLKKKGVNLRLDIIGRNVENLLSKFKQQVKQLQISDMVVFKDEIRPDKVQGMLKEYDFYIQASDNEGMAMTVVEAMQLGIVPIVTPVGEIKNYTKDMYNAIHIPVNTNDYDACLNKIVQVVESVSMYNTLSRNAHKTFLHQLEYKESLIANIRKVISNQIFDEK